MTSPRLCSQCGATLAADAPAGVCPQCVLRLGLESEVHVSVVEPDAQTATPDSRPTPSAGVDPGPTTPGGGGFTPPTVEELQTRFPQLEIIELLGKGGMGAVYKARQPALDRFVALKILPPEVGRDPQFAERFQREARALAKLSHPNIVMVYDFGQSDGLYFLMMEFVDGVNLRQTIRGGTMSPAEALKIVPQICEALQFAHEEGVVHRDIKPENILLDKRGRLKIADFGLAKLLGRADSAILLTQTFQVMGTLHYMAPEQFERPTAVDHRADIYSLGVVFYELLTGQLPLGRYALPSEKATIDARLDDVVLKTLEREPDRRYQHASDVKTDIESISREKPVAAVAPEPARALETSESRSAIRMNVPLLLLAIFSVLAVPLLLVLFLGLQLSVGGVGRLEFLITFAVMIVFLVIGVCAVVALTTARRKPSSRLTAQKAASPADAGERPTLDAATYEQVRRQVQAPAIGLMIAGVLNFAPCLLGPIVLFSSLLLHAQNGARELPQALALCARLAAGDMSAAPLALLAEEAEGVPSVIARSWGFGMMEVVLLPFLLLSIPFGVLMILGGYKMRRMELYGLAMIAACVALLPCSPGFFISLPIGLWALLVLWNPDVKAAFGTKPVLAEVVPEKKPPQSRVGRVTSDEPLDDEFQSPTVGQGNALIVVGVLNVLAVAALMFAIGGSELGDALAGKDVYSPGRANMVGASLGLAAALAAALTIVYGGLQMRACRGYAWAMLASILAALPISPVCLLGFWVGMWSFFTLQATSVRRAFADVRRRSPHAGLAGALPGLALILGPPLLVLAAGAGIAALANMSSPEPIGTIMVYDVQMRAADYMPHTAEEAQAFCEARVNNSKRKIAQVKMLQGFHYETQATRIEIGVYGDDPLVANRIEERLAAKGKIEFAILADREKDAALITRANAVEGEREIPREDQEGVNAAAVGRPLPPVARWVKVSHRCERSLQDAFGAYRDFATRRKTKEGLEILVLVDPLNVTEKEISRARVEESRDTNGVVLDLALNSEGGRKMRSLTSRPENLQTAFKSRRLGLVVDDVLLTAPTLRDVIADRLEIPGDFTLDEANDFVSLVRAGKAPESIKQVSRKTIAK